MLTKVEKDLILIFDSMGRVVIRDLLNGARYYMEYTGGRPQSYHLLERISDGRDALITLLGTGLEVIIDTFGMNYNADMLRKNFFTMTKQRSYISD